MEKFPTTPAKPKREIPKDPILAIPEEMAKEVDFILDHHVTLREKWEEIIEGLPLEGQLRKLQELAAKRREVLAPKPYQSENLSLFAAFPQQVEKMFEEMHHSGNSRSREVDRGYNGKIMEFVTPGPVEQTVVYKMLIRVPIGEQNDILTEASYLADLDMFARQNKDLRVSVPEVFYAATSDDPWIIAMQKVPGHSIENIISENVPVPKDFNIQELESDLMEFVHRLNDIGFHHRDLRVGNIMVDLEAKAGEPLAYVIDTGLAKRVYWKSEEEHKFDKSPDPAMLKKAIESLRSYKIRQEQGSST